MHYELAKIPSALWPIKVIQDHFVGVISGGRWVAYHSGAESERDDEVWNESQCNRKNARAFWERIKHADNAHDFWWIAVGDTPDRAVMALINQAVSTV